MTVQYNGGDSYTIFIEHREFILSKLEIDMIQSYDFTRDTVVDSVTQLQDRLEDLLEVEQDLASALSTVESLEEDISELKEEVYILRKELEQYD